jgi:anti-anti-sigma factor
MTPDHGRSHAAPVRVGLEYPGDPRAVAESFEALPAGMFAFEGPDHFCTAMNRRARELFGDHILPGGTYRATAGTGADERLLGLLDQAYRTGLTVNSPETRLLLTGARRPAGSAPEEHFLTFDAVPLLADSGLVRGVAAQFVDVTFDVRAREVAVSWADQVDQRRLATRSFALAIQHTLLPEFLPVLPGVRLAARYRVAASEQGAGGDWFDAIPLPGGHLALVTGDVAGHGAKASAMMSQLRAALTALVLDGYDVAQVLARLDRFVARMPGANATTLCLAILDPVSGELSYACSGHPPPLVLTAAGVASYLPADRGVPLGTVSAAPRVGHARLAAGDTLMLFTNGLVEAPGRSLAEGLAELRACVEQPTLCDVGAAGGLDEICLRCVQCMTDDEPDDDVSLLAVRRRTDEVAPIRRELEASAGVLPGLRAELAEWLDQLGASELDLRDIQIAVGEAVANVIEHAYAGGEGRFTMELYHDVSGRVCVTVADVGTWRPPPVEPAERGRGLIMIRACMDTVEIDSSETGTTLQMDRRLRRPPILGPADPAAEVTRPNSPAQRFDAVIRRAPQPQLIVSGPVDTSTVTEFRDQLSDASRGGTLPLHIDLTGVTHLASAGVQALFEFLEQMASDGRPLLLTAPPSSPARYVLELTGLDHLVVPEA